jgi:hypothetical protein
MVFSFVKASVLFLGNNIVDSLAVEEEAEMLAILNPKP